LLAGLSVVHADNVLHRDIKPENIYVTTYGVPILIDFGAARQQVGGKSLDVTSIITPGYAPIEQYSTDAKYQGPWSDIYSMAACVYHMITGVKPVPASERSDASRNNQPDPLTPLTQLQPEGYPPQFLAGIDKALQMGEMQRPQSVDTWLTLLGLTDTSAGSTTVVSGPMTGHSGGAQGPQSPRPPGKSGGRKTGVIIAAALVMVALLLGGGFLVVSQLQNNQNKGKGKVRSTAQADQDKPVEKPKEVAQEPKGNDYQPLLTELEVAIKVGEYDKAKDMIRDLDRKDLTQPQRIKLADLRDLREKEMRNCPASLYFRPSPAAVTVDIDGIRGYLASGRYELRGVGKHTVKISASGYEAMEKTVEVASKGQMIDLGTVTLNEDASARLARER
ncbi:MAG: hypothetical protein KDI15_14145, partial [Thiothrix sp.]|nr:hypothetical protein [Thiothrix sp.]